MALIADDSGSDEGGPEAAQPDESWLNADIRAWAEDHGVDLGSATTKADMLAVIREAQ